MALANTERTGWRDEELSRRHRRWGFDCPAVDLDFLVIEYGLGEVGALVEYKHYAASAIDLSHPSYRAVAGLADRCRVPFFVVRYWPESWSFRVAPANALAATEGGGPMSEMEFVALLYRMRGNVIQERVLRHLRTEVRCDDVRL